MLLAVREPPEMEVHPVPASKAQIAIAFTGAYQFEGLTFVQLNS